MTSAIVEHHNTDHEIGRPEPRQWERDGKSDIPVPSHKRGTTVVLLTVRVTPPMSGALRPRE
ncbi:MULTISPECIES: hypothetical protein [Streptomyces]|uniref:Uncharacterized protein n=1 Tax=Streptomyces siderophoricus TaxID=2802281 RepID=A0ABS1MS59_9ACTN|nr:hypothetical protein [Streptomyces sp. 9-7]MBL1090598.1 hypothetical protein [Streptomyces sp. 9-7]